MAELTREQILARKLGGGTTFDLPDGSGSVVLRGLTMQEGVLLSEASGAARTHLMLHFGMVSPALTVEEAGQWAEQDSVGVLTDVADKINELSGMGEGAGKSGPPRPRRRPRS